MVRLTNAEKIAILQHARELVDNNGEAICDAIHDALLGSEHFDFEERLPSNDQVQVMFGRTDSTPCGYRYDH